MDFYQISNQINSLTNLEFELIIQKRKEHLNKFNQLKVGMFFVVHDGHDHYLNEIIDVNFQARIFTYIDHSLINFEELHKKHRYSAVNEIQHVLYANKEDLESNTLFKFKTE